MLAPRDRCRLAASLPARSQALRQARQPQADEVPVVLGELAGDPAPAAEVVRCAPMLLAAVHRCFWSAARAGAPEPAVKAPSAEPACQGLVR